MKYVFFGTPDFSAQFLRALLDHGVAPVAVVTNPDRPIGRKKIITPPPVKVTAEEWNMKAGASARERIEVLQPEKLDDNFKNRIRALAPDLFIVFAYNKIFREDVLKIPRLGALGVHPSFLPEYRGPSPFQTAILDGKIKTGVTLYWLDAGIDSGPIVAKSDVVQITDEDTFNTLATKLTDAAVEVFLKVWQKLGADRPGGEPQDESRATYTKKFKTEDAFIDDAELVAAESGDAGTDTGTNAGGEKARRILRRINAFNPEPGAWTTRDGKRIKLLRARLEKNASGVRRLVLTEIQREGEKPITPQSSRLLS